MNDIGPCIIAPWRTRINGYAVKRIKGKLRLYHRIVLEEKLGRPIRPGFEACHARGCPNRDCINPEHLYEGTRYQNIMDIPREKRSRSGKERRRR